MAEKKYLHKTVKKGVYPRELTLLLTKCFGEEYNSHKHNCYDCKVWRRCRYVYNKNLKPKLLMKYKDQIEKKLKEKEESAKNSVKKIAKLEKKEILKELDLSEKILKKQLENSKNNKFKLNKTDIKKDMKELEKTKKVMEKFFKD